MHLLLALSGTYCNQHPSASNCSGNSFLAEFIGGLIIALPIVLWLLTRLWRRGGPDSRSQSWPTRLATRALSTLVRARAPE